jgi:hypothetical protein
MERENKGSWFWVWSLALVCPSIQCADFAAWQRKYMEGEGLEKQLSYWRRQLASTGYSWDRVRPATQTFHGSDEFRVIPRLVLDFLRELSRQEGWTLFMILLAAFNILLLRAQKDIVVGSAIAGRNRVEIEKLIGFFVNTLVLRTNLSGDPSFQELLGRARETSIGAYAHEDVPFEKLVGELSPELAERFFSPQELHWEPQESE